MSRGQVARLFNSAMQPLPLLILNFLKTQLQLTIALPRCARVGRLRLNFSR